VAINVRDAERDQLWLMPPSVRDWLPEDHLAWFVLDVVGELELTEFYAPYRADGRGGAVYDPALMLGVLVYAYCLGEHSSRRIERRLVEDVGFRVVGANQCPDHATLARFRARHQDAIAGLFAQVLGLCVAEGLVAAGVVAIDGTKVEANASAWSNRTRRQIADEILAEAARVDAAEDAELGERRGGELPERWANPTDRRARLREALRQLDERGASDSRSGLHDPLGCGALADVEGVGDGLRHRLALSPRLPVDVSHGAEVSVVESNATLWAAEPMVQADQFRPA
jgi:transposase